MDTVVTNNPRLRERAGDYRFVEGDVAAVLTTARDLIHCGYRLLVHPLAGNVRPEQLQYKTLVLGAPQPGVDLASLELMETAIARVGGGNQAADGPLTETVRRDLQMLDMDLVKDALPVQGGPGRGS